MERIIGYNLKLEEYNSPNEELRDLINLYNDIDNNPELKDFEYFEKNYKKILLEKDTLLIY